MWCKFTGRFATGRRCYLRALAIMKRALGRDHPALAGIYHNLGGLEHERRDFARGERYARRSVELRRAGRGEGTLGLAADLGALAALVADQGRLDEAEPLYGEALAIFERVHGPEHYEVAVILHNLAALHAQRGDARRAEDLYVRSASLKRAALGADHPDLALTRYNLAVLLYEAERLDEARPLCDAALRVFERELTDGHPTREACRELAVCLHVQRANEPCSSRISGSCSAASG
jgi:tetratricopeptide (TPR) repeat protein